MGIDYSLPVNPVFSPGHITIPTKGEFFNPHQRVPSQFRASQTPDIINPNRMIQIILTDYIPLTITEQFYNRGLIKHTLTGKHNRNKKRFNNPRMGTNTFKNRFMVVGITRIDKKVPRTRHGSEVNF
jgi:hypothetical protein